MKEDILIDAMDGIGDDLIDEWQKKRRYNRRKAQIRKILSMAACITVTIGIAVPLALAQLEASNTHVPGSAISTASIFSGANLYSLLTLLVCFAGIIVTCLVYRRMSRKEYPKNTDL